MLLTSLLLVQTILLVVTSGFLLYPVLAYSRNVVHRTGVICLSISFFLLTISYALSFVLHRPVLSSITDFTSASFAATGLWFFARSFIRTADRRPSLDIPAADGGGFDCEK